MADSEQQTMGPGRSHSGSVRSARVVLPCADLQATLAWFRERLGFRLERISPADDPSRALISGHGLQIELQRRAAAAADAARAAGAAGELHLLCDELTDAPAERTLRAPNGTRVVWVEADPGLTIPAAEPQLVISHPGDHDALVRGRAGMEYRDLLPGRWGGRFIASRIRIDAGGAVPDSVHYHLIRFQCIYCVAGWVRVAYEDQGEPLVLEPGDCVLQPPGIRHRVLESSPGLEVIEVACPAEHDTWLDHDLSLPTLALRPERDFGGQRFVHHVASRVPWTPWRGELFECQTTDIAVATGGLASVATVRCRPGAGSATTAALSLRHDGEFLFLAVLAGALGWHSAGSAPRRLLAGDALAVPAGLDCELTQPTAELRLLEVCLPAGAAAAGSASAGG